MAQKVSPYLILVHASIGNPEKHLLPYMEQVHTYGRFPALGGGCAHGLYRGVEIWILHQFMGCTATQLWMGCLQGTGVRCLIGLGEMTAYPDDVAVGDIVLPVSAIRGDPYRATLNDHGKILVMDTKSGVETEIDLGPSDDPYRVIYHGTPEDWTIVQMDGEPRRYFLMRFKVPDEPKIWHEIDYSTLPLSDFWQLMDYTVDTEGVFFVLICNIPYCVEDTATHFVGKLNPSGGDWTWRTLQHSDRCDSPEGDRQILIDVRGRVWLTGDEVVVAFEPDVFESEGIEETDYVLYSEYNSGYYGGHSLRVGPDGRIWALAMLGEGLAWIDPDVNELEQPLPDWIHEGLSSPAFKFVANYGTLILMVVAILMVYSSVAMGAIKGGKKKG